jgi:ammonia channel protein AmtB
MQCGFALLESGSVRLKNTKNILLKNVMNTCLSALVWWAVGERTHLSKSAHACLRMLLSGGLWVSAHTCRSLPMHACACSCLVGCR